MQSNPDLSIIIVYYKGEHFLHECLRSIRKNKVKTRLEIIVVENSPVKKRLPGVEYIKIHKNVGYGAGCNLGAKHAKGKYLLILNPDTIVLPKSLQSLTNYQEKNSEIAIVAPSLLDRKKKIYQQLAHGELTPLRGIFTLSFISKLFPNNPISNGYWMKNTSFEKACEVDTVAGSAFLIRKTIFEKIGGFDENFFLYFEEVDLCKRVRQSGYKIFLIPEAKIIHFWKPGKPDTKKAKKIFAKSRFYYFKKHYGILWAIIVEAVIRL